jgi:SNARE protein
MNTLGNKRVELFDMGVGISEPTADDNVQVASCETSLSDSQISSNLFDITTWDKRSKYIASYNLINNTTVLVLTQVSAHLFIWPKQSLLHEAFLMMSF